MRGSVEVFIIITSVIPVCPANRCKNPAIQPDLSHQSPSNDTVSIWDPTASETIITEELDKVTSSSMDYQKTQFPTVNYGKPTTIFVSVYVQNFGEVSEANANYAAELYITLMWHDWRLNFSNFRNEKVSEKDHVDYKSSHYFQLITNSDHEKIWIPTVFFSNSRLSEKPSILSDNCVIFILHDGTVIYQTRVMLVPSCPMDLSAFPFDSQNCPLIISICESEYSIKVGYYDNQVILEWGRADRIKPEGGGMTSEEEATLFVKINDEVQSRMTGYTLGKLVTDKVPIYNSSNWHAFEDALATCSQYRTCLRIQFPLQRRYSFYMVDTYFPSSLITALSWLSFWISPEAIPARVALCVTTFLTLQATTGNIRNRLPAVAYVRAVDIWLFGMQTLIFLALIEFIMIHSLLSRNTNIIILGNFRGFFRAVMGKVMGVGTDGQNIRDVHSNEKKERTEDRTMRHQKRAKMIDWISRVAFPCVFALFSVIYYGEYVYTT